MNKMSEKYHYTSLQEITESENKVGITRQTCGNPSTKICTEDPILGSSGPLFLKVFPPRPLPLPLDPPPPLPPFNYLIVWKKLPKKFPFISKWLGRLDTYPYHLLLNHPFLLLFLQSLDPPFPCLGHHLGPAFQLICNLETQTGTRSFI